MLKEMDNAEEKYKLDNMKNLMGDAGYDSGKRNKKLKQEYNINPVIDIKHIWDKEEKYKEIENQMIVYNEEGEVYYIIDLNNYEKMKYLGYDKENNALRYTRYSTGKKIYRIPLETDYRIFMPIARDSKKFKKKYKMRAEIERLICSTIGILRSFLVRINHKKTNYKSEDNKWQYMVKYFRYKEPSCPQKVDKRKSSKSYILHSYIIYAKLYIICVWAFHKPTSFIFSYFLLFFLYIYFLIFGFSSFFSWFFFFTLYLYHSLLCITIFFVLFVISYPQSYKYNLLVIIYPY